MKWQKEGSEAREIVSCRQNGWGLKLTFPFTFFSSSRKDRDPRAVLELDTNTTILTGKSLLTTRDRSWVPFGCFETSMGGVQKKNKSREILPARDSRDEPI